MAVNFTFEHGTAIRGEWFGANVRFEPVRFDSVELLKSDADEAREWIERVPDGKLK